MGNNAAFFDHEGIARPALVAAFKALPNPPRDPELLARLIDGHAGIDLDLKLLKFEEDRRSARREVLDLMINMKRDAQALRKLQKRHPELNLFEIALQDLAEIVEPDSVAATYVRRLSAAVEHLAEARLPPNLSFFGKKPSNDAAVQHVVNAVAEYHARLGMDFSGAPRRTQTNEGTAYPLHSEPAKLTAAVLNSLGLSVPQKSLATYMVNARKATDANLPT